MVNGTKCFYLMMHLTHLYSIRVKNYSEKERKLAAAISWTTLSGYLLLVRFLMCTFRACCYSTRLSWAHTQVINCVVTLLEFSEREEGVVAIHLSNGY